MSKLNVPRQLPVPEPASSQVLLTPVHSDPQDYSGEKEVRFSYYWSILARHRRMILTFVLLTTAVVTMITLVLPKQYESSVLLRVDPQGKTSLNDTQNQNSVFLDANLLVATEAKVVTSPAVVIATIEQTHLADDPEFAKDARPSGTATVDMDRLLRAVLKRISVDQPVGTLLLQIGFRSHDRQIAANVANALASSFLEHEYSTRARALADSSKYMSAQSDALRAQMERDQRALVSYESSNDVIDPDDKNNIYEARLSQINTDLSQAQSERMRIEAGYEVARSQNLDALLASPRGQALIPLQDRLISDQRALSRMATIYGPNHPLYRQQSAVVLHDEQVLAQQQVHITNQIDTEYQAAVNRENLIHSALDREKQAMDAFNMRAIQYHALKAASDSSTKLYYDLQQRIQDATVSSGLRSEDLRIISPAKPTDKPVAPRPILAAILTLIGSTLAAIAITIGSAMMDRTVSTPEQVEMRFRVPALASLPLVPAKSPVAELSVSTYAPKLRGLSATDEHESLRRRSAFQEAILNLHTAIQFAVGGGVGVLAVTSSLPGEGKSTVACHLAASFAALGVRTVLVDADMRKPNVHRLFRIPNRQGLSSVLRGTATLDEALQSQSSQFAVLPAGPTAASPTELLHVGLPEIIDQLRTQYDLVLIDCPPVLGFADSSVVSNLAEAVIFVLSAGDTEQQFVAASLRQLRATRTNLIGIVLNRVSASLDSYYKTYYRSYYNTEAELPDDN